MVLVSRDVNLLRFTKFRANCRSLFTLLSSVLYLLRNTSQLFDLIQQKIILAKRFTKRKIRPLEIAQIKQLFCKLLNLLQQQNIPTTFVDYHTTFEDPPTILVDPLPFSQDFHTRCRPPRFTQNFDP